jgi:hypothetical protein
MMRDRGWMGSGWWGWSEGERTHSVLSERYFQGACEFEIAGIITVVSTAQG